MCPGRFIALNEMRVFAAVLMRHYAFEAAADGGAPSARHEGVGDRRAATWGAFRRPPDAAQERFHSCHYHVRLTARTPASAS